MMINHNRATHRLYKLRRVAAQVKDKQQRQQLVNEIDGLTRVGQWPLQPPTTLDQLADVLWHVEALLYDLANDRQEPRLIKFADAIEHIRKAVE